MSYQAIVIRTLEDFTQVPVDELPQCLHVFGAWVLEAKAQLADIAKIQEAPSAKF